MTTRIKRLGRQSVSRFGAKVVTEQTVEELAELIVALKHLDRRKVDKLAVLSEISDVEIVLTQLKLILTNDKEYGKILSEKMDKWEKTINAKTARTHNNAVRVP